MSVHVAVDLGASSGRVMVGSAGPGVLGLEEVHRFANGPVPVAGSWFTDAVGLWQQVRTGLRAVARHTADASSVAVDTWAVDYGLLAADGTLLGTPGTTATAARTASPSASTPGSPPWTCTAATGCSTCPSRRCTSS